MPLGPMAQEEQDQVCLALGVVCLVTLLRHKLGTCFGFLHVVAGGKEGVLSWEMRWGPYSPVLDHDVRPDQV